MTACTSSCARSRRAALAQTLDRWEHGDPEYDLEPRAPRPWTSADGDPAHPVRVLGLAITEHLRVRADVPGALVVLEDGRYAITGPALLVGDAGPLRRYAGERLERAEKAAARLWWRDVLDALGPAAPVTPTRRPGSAR